VEPPQILDLLRRTLLFRDVPQAELANVAASSHRWSARKEDRIFSEGQSAKSCFVFVSGRGKIVTSGRDGSEIILNIVEPLELVGELALLDKSPRSATLAAMRPSELIEIPQGSFLALRSNRAFEEELMLHVAAMLRRATDRQRVMTYAAGDRVFWCLVGLALRSGQPVNKALVVSPKPTHQELADMTGLTRETVSRRLVDLESEGRVRTTPKAYVLAEDAGPTAT